MPSIALSGLKATHAKRIAARDKLAASKAVARRQFKASKRASKAYNGKNHGAALKNLKRMHSVRMQALAGF